MRKFKAVLFDWDGTLFNSRWLNYHAVLEIFGRFGLPAPTEEEYFSGISADYMEFYYSRGIPKGTSSDALNAIRKEFMQQNWKKAALHDYVFMTLLSLGCEGLKVGIVSAENSDILKERVIQHGLTQFLDCMIGDAFDKKAAIEKTLKTFRINPQECLFVDDSPKDLLRIKESGVFTLGITHGFGSPERIAAAKPDLIVSSVRDVLSFVDADI